MPNHQLEATSLACEWRTDPIGIDCPRPRLSWQLTSSRRGSLQSAYRVQAATTRPGLTAGGELLWDSGRIESDNSVEVEYEGPRLPARASVWWRVMVWDECGSASGWSEPGRWEMGLLGRSDWSAEWIGLDDEELDYIDPPNGDDLVAPNLQLQPSPYLRRSFAVDRPVVKARLYVTARGLYEVYLNGERVGEAVLAPGWTDYHKRIHYQTYDVCGQLRQGENAIGAILGDGWYCGYVGFNQKRRGAHYGWQPSLLAQLELEYEDGERMTVSSDGLWRSCTGPVLFSDLLMGEWYDSRKELPGWESPGYDDSAWYPVSLQSDIGVVPTAETGPAVEVTEHLLATSVSEPTRGTFVFDLGQNMVGWARLHISGRRGSKVTLRFAEMLESDGTIHTENWRSARPVDTYILKGEGVETFEPRFTFHGFRYVEVTGLEEKPDLDALLGVVVGSALDPAGSFECSNAMVDQLQRNIVWTQRGNFLSVPTDCPQRDERLGWLGDAQIYAATACLNMNAASFFEKWMDDVVDAQSGDGAFPDVAPRMAEWRDGAPAWGDAGVIIPWTIYQHYGSTRVIERYYDAMAAWIDFVHAANPAYLRTKKLGRNYGDWLAIDTGTPKELLATAYFAYIVDLMSRMARATGQLHDAKEYRRLFERIRDAFNDAYVAADGRVKGETQTCYLLALHMDLLPPELRPLAAERLVADIRARDWHLSTGFIGVGYLCPVLTEMGYEDVAYRLLLNESYPSWGYSIGQGATTIWERWDGWTEDGGFQTPSMNSFNHYSLGSIGEWLYRYVAGIDLDPENPGYRHFYVRPRPGGGLRYAKASYRSVRGLIQSEWEVVDDGLELRVAVPANASATVEFPVEGEFELFEGERPLSEHQEIAPISRSAVRVGSGNYEFNIVLASAFESRVTR